jgi:putrescine aminotransferase
LSGRIFEDFMSTNTESSGDSEVFESYERLINPSYPSFLAKLGLSNVAAGAQGATITDSQGRTFIDCIGGYGICNVGHNNPEIVRSLTDQLREQQLLTKPLIAEVQVRAAECIEEIAPGDLTCSFILNSGSEAIDCAIKLVRLHRGGKTIITARGSFFGHTFGALSATGIPSFNRSFRPLLPGFVNVPFGDIEALEQSITEETAAVMIEPVQHEAGVVVPPDGYLGEVRNLCDRHNLILVLDEIKTGIGKTGRMFACEHYGVVPDILVLGKSLGGGLVPIGAVVAKESLWKRFGMSFSMSASSYAGNVLACRAALETIRFITGSGLIEECAQKGGLLLDAFRGCVDRYPDVLRSADGLGLLIGIETMNGKVTLELAQEMIKQGILTVPAYGNSSVLMVEPPLVISSRQIRTVIDSFNAACAKVDHTGRK